MVGAGAGAAGVAGAVPGGVCVWQPAKASTEQSETSTQRQAEADDCFIRVRVYVPALSRVQPRD